MERGSILADVPGEFGAWLDILLDTVPNVIIAIATLIIGFILAYVAGELVREVCCHFGRDRAVGISGSKVSMVAGKIAKALVFAISAVFAIDVLVDSGLFGDGGPLVENYAIRLVVGLLVMFVGAFLADLTAATVAKWLHGGSCELKETDPTRELVFLGIIVSVVMMGLGIMTVDSPAVLLIFLAFLVIGALMIFLQTRRKICRKL